MLRNYVVMVVMLLSYEHAHTGLFFGRVLTYVFMRLICVGAFHLFNLPA